MIVEHRSFSEVLLHIPCGYIRDFQFATGRRLQIPDHIEAAVVIHVTSGDREVRLRCLGLLFDFCNTVAVHGGHTEALRVVHFLQKEMSTFLESADIRTQIIEVDVVTQNGADGIACGKTLSESKCLRDALRLILHAVTELTSESSTRTEEACHLIHMFASGNDDDFLDSCIQKDLEGIENQRTIVNREETLIGNLRQGPKTCTAAAANEDSFHAERA